MIKLIVAGSRSIKDYTIVEKELTKLLSGVKVDNVICGMAEGPDLFGKRYADEHGIGVLEFPAAWKDLTVKNCKVVCGKFGEYNSLAGFNRNEEMACVGSHLIAFLSKDSKTHGTQDMIDRATKHGLKVKVVKV
jgi:hypothetical protein